MWESATELGQSLYAEFEVPLLWISILRDFLLTFRDYGCPNSVLWYFYQARPQNYFIWILAIHLSCASAWSGLEPALMIQDIKDKTVLFPFPKCWLPPVSTFNCSQVPSTNCISYFTQSAQLLSVEELLWRRAHYQKWALSHEWEGQLWGFV